MAKDLYEIGEQPPLGEVPKQMHAQLIRPERFGEPTQGLPGREGRDVPQIGPREVLVYVMAAGDQLQQRLGGARHPVDVIKAREREGDTTGFHIGGSRRLRHRLRVGEDVTNVKVGDEVVVHCGMWDRGLARS